MTESKQTIRTRLLEKLPEILIEAASVVSALILALALNQWNESREIAARASSARAAILAELTENRGEIERARPALKAIVQDLRGVIGNKDSSVRQLNVNLGVSLLSSAAWRAALATQATQTIDFQWMTKVAKVYELQDNYLRVQASAVEQLTSIPADPDLAGPQVAGMLVSRMRGLEQLADGLVVAYTDVLDPTPKR